MKKYEEILSNPLNQFFLPHPPEIISLKTHIHHVIYSAYNHYHYSLLIERANAGSARLATRN